MGGSHLKFLFCNITMLWLIVHILLHAVGGYAFASLIWLFVSYAYAVPTFELHARRGYHEGDERDSAESRTLVVYSLDNTLSPVSIPFCADFDAEYKQRMSDIGMSLKEMYNGTYYVNFIIYLLILSRVHVALTLFTLAAWWMSQSDEEIYHQRVRDFVEEVERTPFPLMIVTEGTKENAERELKRMKVLLRRVVVLATNGKKVDKGLLAEQWLKRHYEDWKFEHNHSFGYVVPPLERVLLVDSDPEACKKASCKDLDMEVLPVERMVEGDTLLDAVRQKRSLPGLFHHHRVVDVLTSIVRCQQI